MDHNKFSSLYSAVVVNVFQYLCQCRRGKRSKWGSILSKKSSRATLPNHDGDSNEAYCTQNEKNK